MAAFLTVTLAEGGPLGNALSKRMHAYNGS